MIGRPVSLGSTKCPPLLRKESVVKAAITPRYKKQRKCAPGQQHSADGSNGKINSTGKQDRQYFELVDGRKRWEPATHTQAN
jgi:hypothetical protein